jgi:hypothetical protein
LEAKEVERHPETAGCDRYKKKDTRDGAI